MIAGRITQGGNVMGVEGPACRAFKIQDLGTGQGGAHRINIATIDILDGDIHVAQEHFKKPIGIGIAMLDRDNAITRFDDR